MAACAITSWITSTASGFRRTRMFIRWGRPCRKSGPKCSPTPSMVKSNDPNALVLRPGGMGLERIFLQRLRPAMVRPARRFQCGGLSGPDGQRRLGLYALAAEPVPSVRHAPTTSACWIISPFIVIRRKATSAEMRLTPRRSCCGTNPRACSGTPITWIPVGSIAIIMLIPRMKNWVGDLLSRHEDRHHRIQLGRRAVHQRRDRPGRYSGHLRTGRSWTWRPAGPRRPRTRPPIWQ